MSVGYVCVDGVPTPTEPVQNPTMKREKKGSPSLTRVSKVAVLFLVVSSACNLMLLWDKIPSTLTDVASFRKDSNDVTHVEESISLKNEQRVSCLHEARKESPLASTKVSTIRKTLTVDTQVEGSEPTYVEDEEQVASDESQTEGSEPTYVEDELPADEEPADEEPADEEPADEEPANGEPANEEPANEEPANEDPADEEPANEEPEDEEPEDEEPLDEEPADEGPADEEPADEEPANGEPANEEPADEEPANEDPADEEPANEEPEDEEPLDEEPADEGPADEEPADEEPADEEPADEEQIVTDETQVDESSYIEDDDQVEESESTFVDEEEEVATDDTQVEESETTSVQNDERRHSTKKKGRRAPKIKVTFPVFVASLYKSGTTTVHAYFECGGVKAVHNQGENVTYTGSCIKDRILQNIHPVLEGCGGDHYDVYSDNADLSMPQVTCFDPSVHGLDAIYESYPSATILLTVRDSAEWIKSVTNYRFGDWDLLTHLQECKDLWPTQQKDIGSNRNLTKDEIQNFYDWHTRHVRSFAKAHPSMTYIELPLAHKNAGAILEQKVGIPSTCWGQHNTKEERRKEFGIEAEVQIPLCSTCNIM